ncbi:neuropeptide CCHamide-2 [Neodiprion fabricii]|uniref:neuropeptide CCHamide-2 n=1 Tax=Neodiprion fabricii TaxID=2872261 RepID=UPI001ED949F4|nr:neuropeptide CCHamide-2 [Neodiprion fabricii]
MKTSILTTASSRPFVGVVIIVVLCFAIEVSAKRGCSAFGHSCFGGHGKRSGSSDRIDDGLQENMNSGLNQEGQEYESPRGGGEILLADAGQVYQDRPMPRFQPPQVLGPQEQHPRYNLSPFIRQWLASYRSGNSADYEAN